MPKILDKTLRHKICVPKCSRKVVLLFFFIVVMIILNTAFINWKVKTVKPEPLISNWTRNIFSKFLTKQKLKYILLWNDARRAPLSQFKTERDAFIEYQCSVNTCHVTDDKNQFGDLGKFDAIIFDGYKIATRTNLTLPNRRYPHQKYVFLIMESYDNYPICSQKYDNFFNWTSTYQLHSDIPFTYIAVHNKTGDIIGPQRKMHWINPATDLDEEFAKTLRSKTKAAAWFVSNKHAKSGRENFVKDLQIELKKHNLQVDVYGRFGNLTCDRNMHERCLKMLQRDYFFYLAFESTYTEDYVTEKLLHALHGSVVPIVLGGADYSRFLPPGSYIDVKGKSPRNLAATMVKLMNSPKLYRQYFNWKSNYIYSDLGYVRGICKLCEMLNDKAQFEVHSAYEDFRLWWHPRYKSVCSEDFD